MTVFKSTRRLDGDGGCEWAHNNDLNCQFSSIFQDADFYTIRHWFLRCGCAPCLETFVTLELLEEYITKYARAGDSLEIWAVEKDKMNYINAKMPDENGMVPVKGCAY